MYTCVYMYIYIYIYIHTYIYIYIYIYVCIQCLCNICICRYNMYSIVLSLSNSHKLMQTFQDGQPADLTGRGALRTDPIVGYNIV